MKRIVILVVFMQMIFACMMATEWRGGVDAGINLSRPLSDGYNGNAESVARGYYIGGKCELAFKSADKGWFADGGMRLSSKPYNGRPHTWPMWINDEYIYHFVKFNTRPYYLEFPFHIGYRFKINENMSVYPAAGPYMAIGLFGSSKAIFMDSAYPTIFKHDEGNPFKDYNESIGNHRFDAGFTCKVGLEFIHHFQMNLGYSVGFTTTDSRRNSVVSIGATWMF